MNIARFILQNCPRLMVAALMLLHALFLVVAFAYPLMALHNYDTWWLLFARSFWSCLLGYMACYFVALAVHTKRILRPERRENPFYNYRTDDCYVDIQRAAIRLAEKARTSARRHNNTDHEAALFLISAYEVHRHEFTSMEQSTMRKVVARAVEILRDAQ